MPPPLTSMACTASCCCTYVNSSNSSAVMGALVLVLGLAVIRTLGLVDATPVCAGSVGKVEIAAGVGINGPGLEMHFLCVLWGGLWLWSLQGHRCL